MRSRVRVPSSPPANTNLLNHFRFFVDSILCKLGPNGAKRSQLLGPRLKRSALFAYKRIDVLASPASKPIRQLLRKNMPVVMPEPIGAGIAQHLARTDRPWFPSRIRF